ncbi:MAG: cephalosporin hydroxylase family protein [Chloroflexi bacterium]|nr:cephalosporin hydroxylase family protein [Chloroflexota bacterium]
MNTADASSLVDQFHTLYYSRNKQTWGNTFWLGHQVLKCPLDLWTYQEILHDVQPELIIETGTYRGGSALFLASMSDLLRRGEVVTIDSARQKGRPRHRRITYLTGSSTSAKILRQVRRRAKGKAAVLVILDSGHSKDHVLAELNAYAPFVTPGSYLVVEDTNLNGHPVLSRHGPGPAEAVAEFLERNDAFVRDESREKFLLTFNPGGFLKKRETAVRSAAAGSVRGRLRRYLRIGQWPAGGPSSA